MIINELRKKTGLSQLGFSKQFGVPVRTLQQWEQGRSCPPVYVIELLKKEIENRQALKIMDGISELKLKNKKNWKNVPGVEFKNSSKIHPLQQRKVADILSEIRGNKDVKKVYVFGSSVSNRCHIGSDLDLYIEMKVDKNPLKKSYPFEVDQLNNFHADQRIIDEIKKKGVIVYG